MAFLPYIHFNGTCAEAMTFYCSLFHGTDLQMMKYSDMPVEEGGAPSDRILHSQFTAAGEVLMASDTPPGMDDSPQQGVSIMIEPATLTESQRLFDALADGGAVIIPMSPTSWSPGFGMIKDRFDTHWIIGTQPAP